MNKIDSIRALVRPFIAFSLVGTIVALAFMGKLDPAEILRLAMIAMAFYFGERAALKRPGEKKPDKPEGESALIEDPK